MMDRMQIESNADRTTMASTAPLRRPAVPGSQHPAAASSATTSPPPAPMPPGARTGASQAEIDARMVAELAVPGALSVILGEELAGRVGVKLAFEDFLKRAGAPVDPVEQCLLEQYFLAHHRLARLQADASAAKNLEGSKILNAAAVRLLSELRRLALSIRQYRAPLAARAFSVIHQQNVAASGGQQDVKFVQDPAGKETLVCRDGPNDPGKEDDLHALRERAIRGEQRVGKKVAPAASATLSV